MMLADGGNEGNEKLNLNERIVFYSVKSAKIKTFDNNTINVY